MINNYQTPKETDTLVQDANIITVKEWLITFLILCIPVVNLVMPFVWAFGSNAKKSKANYFKAYLLSMAVFFSIYIVIVLTFNSLLLAYL